MVLKDVLYLALVFSLLITSCGGGGGNNSSNSGNGGGTSSEYRSVTVAGYPNQTDIYRTLDANKAVIFLHGGGGTNYHMAYQLGINLADASPSTSTANWSLLEADKVLAVFPQGQAVTSAPNAFTWNNHVMDSGQDDVAFLQALAAYIKSQYGISDIYLAGHSNGGMMVNRMWCESPDTFKAYISLAGPASEYYLTTVCNPSSYKPYYGVVGDSDTVLQDTGIWYNQTWTINSLLVSAASAAFVDPNVIGEWYQQGTRANLMCSEAIATDGVTAGALETWSNCNGRLKLQKVLGAEHNLGVLNTTASTANGQSLVDLIVGFVNGLPTP